MEIQVYECTLFFDIMKIEREILEQNMSSQQNLSNLLISSSSFDQEM